MLLIYTALKHYEENTRHRAPQGAGYSLCSIDITRRNLSLKYATVVCLQMADFVSQFSLLTIRLDCLQAYNS